MWLVSLLSETGICHVFGVAVLFNKAVPIVLKLEYRILIACNGKNYYSIPSVVNIPIYSPFPLLLSIVSTTFLISF